MVLYVHVLHSQVLKFGSSFSDPAFSSPAFTDALFRRLRSQIFAAFDLIESRFRFIVNLDSNSLANRMVSIREHGRV